jgi:ribonuclease HI
MPFKSVLHYFENDGQSMEDKIIIHPNKNITKKPPKPIVSSEEEADFLSLFLMPKAIANKKHKSAPQKPAPEQETPTDNKILLVYTDGSCILNGKPNARGGWAVYFPGGEFPNMAEKYTNHPTNQRCELTAIWRALQTIQNYLAEGGQAQLYTDSEYSIKCLMEYCRKWSQNGWLKADKKPIENRDIIEPLYLLYTQVWRNVQIKHIRAHTGNQDKHSIANDIVDQMARQTLSSNH